jgi:hypothetical protein
VTLSLRHFETPRPAVKTAAAPSDAALTRQVNKGDTMTHDFLNRRRVLRGMLNGGAVTVGLPLLNCFLNGNGTALADGSPMPVRFGTWFWGLGMSKSIFVPKKSAPATTCPRKSRIAQERARAHQPAHQLDGLPRHAPNLCHYTGWVIPHRASRRRTGNDRRANHRRHRRQPDRPHHPLQDPDRHRHRRRARASPMKRQTTPNAPKFSPLNFYTRLFGPDFQDPNAPSSRPTRASWCARACCRA